MLTNIGYIPIYSVKVVCGDPTGVGFRFTTGPADRVEPGESIGQGVLARESEFSAVKLSPFERHPFTCFGFIPTSFNSSMGRTAVASHAWVRVKVFFSLFDFPMVFSNEFPFDGILENDGAVHWRETFLKESRSTTLTK